MLHRGIRNGLLIEAAIALIIIALIRLEIEFDKCPSFRNTLLERAVHVDLSSKLRATGKGIAGHKKHIETLITDSLMQYEEMAVQLFGHKFVMINDEPQIEYLKSLIQ